MSSGNAKGASNANTDANPHPLQNAGIGGFGGEAMGFMPQKSDEEVERMAQEVLSFERQQKSQPQDQDQNQKPASSGSQQNEPLPELGPQSILPKANLNAEQIQAMASQQK
ncbi:hypothetical protein CXG81DRAFT_19567 [Caulochytrium protostelioides]|uniref:Uncharacterized protein n=1 Tax=Caulochytrium protostelioides TaxID=1555241 RepID=A0A4P9X5R9_9FUNG|nr:hypothetical protein CXG81DRAFT_19567 [Caulochytrium protostelioides]|eukprot:RKP00495.1 hypothetical protein CXG81DRAFT_19567 [Caulochytrium protostelioides]